jgi:predicted nucleic acid-binding protein
MKGVLADSCILIDALRNRNGRRDHLDAILRTGLDICSCAVTVAELHAGFRPKETRATVELLAALTYRSISPAPAARAALWRREWASRGRTLALPDLLIAAVAEENDLFLLTDNLKDFPMSGLRVGAALPSTP